MSSTIFLTDNLLEQASLSVTDGTENFQDSLKLANIKHYHTTKICRIDGATASIVLDLGSISPADIFCITGDVEQGLGFTTCVVKGSATTDFSGSTVHNVTVNHEHNFGFIKFTEESHRYWEISFTGDAYIDISNLFLGTQTFLENNGFALKGFTFGYKELSKKSTNLYNQDFIDEYPSIKYIKGAMKTLSGPEFDTMKDLYKNHRTIKPFWFLLDPDGNMPETDSEWTFSGYMKFKKEFVFKKIVSGIYDISVELEQNS